MTDARRRLALQACAALPLWATGGVPAAVASSASRLTQASDYRRGGLRGFVIGRLGDPLDDAFLDALAATGARLARVFWIFGRCEECAGFERSDRHVAELRRLLQRARARGIRLVVVGEFEHAAEPAFWTNEALRESFVQSWAWFARTLGNDAAIAGLDLLNEPVPPIPDGDVARGQAAWHPLADAAIAAIRAEGVRLPIIFEPVAGGNVIGLKGMTPFADPQVVYSIHFYTPHDITHQGVSPGWQRRIPYPADATWRLGAWDRELGIGAIDARRLRDELRGAVAFQQRYDVPLYVGEFSCVRWAPDHAAVRWVRDCLGIFAANGWSWTYHEFRGWPGWDAEIDSDDPAARTRTADAPVMAQLRHALATR